MTLFEGWGLLPALCGIGGVLVVGLVGGVLFVMRKCWGL